MSGKELNANIYINTYNCSINIIIIRFFIDNTLFSKYFRVHMIARKLQNSTLRTMNYNQDKSSANIRISTLHNYKR